MLLASTRAWSQRLTVARRHERDEHDEECEPGRLHILLLVSFCILSSLVRGQMGDNRCCCCGVISPARADGSG